MGRLVGSYMKFANKVRFNIGMLLHYIPASNYIGGFKEGVAFALQKCRRCQATADDM